MNIGFYFAILIVILLLLGRNSKSPILKTTSGIDVLSKDRIELSRVVAALLIVLGYSQMTLEIHPNYPAALSILFM